MIALQEYYTNLDLLTTKSLCYSNTFDKSYKDSNEYYKGCSIKHIEEVISGLSSKFYNIKEAADIWGSKACYYPTLNEINVFAEMSRPTYYYVIFHEMAHATGHSSRLNRERISSLEEGYSYPTEDYLINLVLEELMADLTAIIVLKYLGFDFNKYKYVEFNVLSHINSSLKGYISKKDLLKQALTQADVAAAYIIKQIEELKLDKAA